MSGNVIIDNILKYIARLDAEKLAISDKDVICVKADGGFYATPIGKALVNVKAEDIKLITVAKEKDYALAKSIFDTREDIGAIIHAHSKHCTTIAKAGVKIPPVLDDMAQIIGPSAKCTKDNEIASILKTLKGRNACFIKGEGVIGTGRTLDESFTGCLVLEKAAKVYVEAVAIGGAKNINIVEATLMHFIFKKKYSKQDQDAKMSELKK